MYALALYFITFAVASIYEIMMEENLGMWLSWDRHLEQCGINPVGTAPVFYQWLTSVYT